MVYSKSLENTSDYLNYLLSEKIDYLGYLEGSLKQMPNNGFKFEREEMIKLVKKEIKLIRSMILKNIKEEIEHGQKRLLAG